MVNCFIDLAETGNFNMNCFIDLAETGNFNIQQCLDLFTEPEILSPEEAW